MDLIALLTGDSARYPPCPGIVGHQHNEPASETYECRERCTFGTPFFFVDLDNDVLTFFENLLDDTGTERFFGPGAPFGAFGGARVNF